MVTVEDIFYAVYGHSKHFITSRIIKYIGFVNEDGTPNLSTYICELSYGKFEGIMVFGVTVLGIGTKQKDGKRN